MSQYIDFCPTLIYNITTISLGGIPKKKKNIINLIRYHSEGNEAGFRSEAYEVAKEFDQLGDYQLAEYIMALLSNANTFVPQVSDLSSGFFEKVTVGNDPLPLPKLIEQDVMGMVNILAGL